MSRLFTKWPKYAVVRVCNDELGLIGEMRKGRIDIYDAVYVRLSDFGNTLYISIKLVDEDYLPWSWQALDDAEKLIIEDFRQDDYHANPDLIFGSGFPLSSEATWKVFVTPYIYTEDEVSQTKL